MRRPCEPAARRRVFARAALRARRRRADRRRSRWPAPRGALAAGTPASAEAILDGAHRAPARAGTTTRRRNDASTPTSTAATHHHAEHRRLRPTPDDSAGRTTQRARRPRPPRGSADGGAAAQTEAERRANGRTRPDRPRRRSAKGASGQEGRRRGRTTSPPRRRSSPQAAALEAMLDVLRTPPPQALTFYRIPLFLLPIYKAAAVQYGVPWQILAAINEIETDYGTDLSVSTAGAVGWMQFMPAHLAAVRRGRPRRRLRGPLQPRRRGLRRRALPARGRRVDRPAGGDPRLQPLRGICRLGAAAREADLDLPEGRDRDAHRPDRRPPAGHRHAASPGRSLPAASPSSGDGRHRAAPQAPSASARPPRPRPRRAPNAPRLRRAAAPAPRPDQRPERVGCRCAGRTYRSDGRVSPARQVRRPARRLRRRVHLRRPRQRRPRLLPSEATAFARRVSGRGSDKHQRSRTLPARQRGNASLR